VRAAGSRAVRVQDLAVGDRRGQGEILDRLLGNDRFRRWAARFPLTRPIARRRAGALFDLTAGFVYAQVLGACVRLRLFERLLQSPATALELAHEWSLPADRAERLLEAAQALDLVELRGAQRYGLGPLGTGLAENPGLVALIAHHELLYADLADPLALLRGETGRGALGRFWGYAGNDSPAALPDQAVRDYTQLMAASQSLVAAQALDAYPLKRHRRLLDVGGGDGSFIAAAAAQAPALQLMLFDLPPVAERARQRLGTLGLAARASVHAGDFLRDELPGGADIISLVRVLHDHPDEAVARILGAARRALPPGGTVLVVEPMSGTRGARRLEAYFGLYLLAMGSGRPRSARRVEELLRAAGFRAVRRHATTLPLLASVLSARAAPEC
jgi:demethylspheroidene O-methyltransferase